MLIPVQQPAAAFAEGELIYIDQVVEHLWGDRGEAARAGATLTGGQGVGAKLAHGPAVTFAVLFGNGDLGLDDGRLEQLKLGLMRGGLGLDLFSSLSDGEVDDLAHRVDEVTWEPGTTVFFEGDRGDECFVIHSGQVKLHQRKSNPTSSRFWMMKMTSTPPPNAVAIVPRPSLRSFGPA